MLEYLILNNRIEAACRFKESSPKTIRQQLLNWFNKGKRDQFFRYFALLRQDSKLQFYLRVYFLIYSIHPSIKSKTSIPDDQINSFKEYLNNKGAQLAKTNEFLQFYALPFIKKHLEHPAFKTLFKKEWITNLKDKLTAFIDDEEKRMKEKVKKFQSQNKVPLGELEGRDENNQKIKQMQSINKQLFEEVKQFTEKYLQLEENHKAMIEKFNYHLMQSQSKWFQITKELVNCSKNLIQMITRVKSNILNDRKFIKIQRRIEKYQRFVNRKLDDLISQSQDISIFDKPSHNQLSCTVTPYTQKNITTFLAIEQFIPINVNQLKQDFQRMKANQKKLVMQGISWRIRRSKNTMVQRQNIVVLFLNDLLGVRTGEVISLISSSQLLKPTLQLLSAVSLDRYGLKQLFIKGKLYKDLVVLLTQSDNQQCIQYLCIILQQLTFQQDYNKELIAMGLINIFLNMLKQVWLNSNENIVENILACLLNFSHMKIGIDTLETQLQIFQILTTYLNAQTPPLIKVMTIGILYCLSKRKKMFERAEQFKLLELIEEKIYGDEDANSNQLQTLAESYRVFNDKVDDHQHFFDQENQIQNQSLNLDDGQPYNMDQLIKGHQMLIMKYSLMGKEAVKQTEEVLKIVNEFLRNSKSASKQVKPKINKKQNLSSNNHQKEQQKISHEFVSPSFKKEHEKVIKPKQSTESMHIHKIQNIVPAQSNYISQKAGQSGLQKNSANLVPGRQQKHNNLRNKKTNLVERNIATPYRKEKYYDLDSQGGQIAEFKPTEQKQFRSPQIKPSRQEVLKQLNEELRAIKHVSKEVSKPKNHSLRQNPVRENRHFGSHKNLSAVGEDDSEAFQSRPKLRRTPPKQ